MIEWANRSGSTNIWLVSRNGFGVDCNVSHFNDDCPICACKDELHLDDQQPMGEAYECLACSGKFFVVADGTIAICTR